MSRTLFFAMAFFVSATAAAQPEGKAPEDTLVTTAPKSKGKVLYGLASYYAEKFNGRPTASGEIYDGAKMTAACNQLPLGSWIRVTNLSNNRSVVVKTNDRLHARMTRVVDLSRTAAEKLGYVKKGLTRVKVEVLERK